MDFFNQLSFWHWLIFAMLLLGAEAMGAGGFLIGAAIAAGLVTLVSLIGDNLSWQLQVVIFAIATMVFSIIYHQRFKKFNDTTDQPSLNNRMMRMQGIQFTLADDLVGNQGSQQIGDTRWRLKAQQPLTANTKVVVTGNDNLTLLIESVEN